MPVRTPVATYRFQLNREFPLEAALRLVPYLDSLGVTDLYASPIFPARTGSTHGYDATDYGRLNPLLGEPGDLGRLASALRERGMGLLLDLVPNHMGIADPSNAWWEDVLTNGQRSRYARYFDIDWSPPDPALRGKVLLPVLGAPYAEVLARGELVPALEGERPVIRYFDRPFPVSPESAGALRRAIAEGPVESARLDRILSAQHYVLAYWRDGLRRINYRRFFDISHLVGVRVEDPEVFAAVHAQVLRWVGEGWVTGIRVDHPDGLTDPTGYFRDLQAGCARALGGAPAAGGEARACYVVAEKILTGDERLRADWAVHGTTGYEFLNDLNGLFVDARGAASLRAAYGRITGSGRSFADLAYACKREVLESRFPAELEGLRRRLAALPGAGGPGGSGASEGDLAAALAAVIASFPVYRTYLRRGETRLAAPERACVREALAAARARHAEVPAPAFDFLARTLDPEAVPDPPSAAEAARVDFVVRFQQLTAPVMAKGVEDTAFYRDAALLSLNEVGGEPSHGGISPEEFHARNAHRLAHWPDGLLATSTHDTKRGEDARARLNVLSEVPDVWEAAVGRWREMNRRFRRMVDGEAAPDAGEECLLYQTLVGAWPLDPMDGPGLDRFAARIRAFMRKALREAKVHTRWIDAREDYESAVDAFLRDILGDPGSAFLVDLRRFHERVAFPGAMNGLSQLLLKIASPGVPDFYQGTEFWDFRLVDPDNRRPVDYDARIAALERPAAAPDRGARVTALMGAWRDGRIKLHVMRAALHHRRSHAALYARGDYRPLPVVGAAAASACGFARALAGEWCVAAAGRLYTRVAGPGGGVTGDAWGDTRIVLPAGAPRRWIDVLTGDALEAEAGPGGETLALRRVFRRLPVTLLAPAAA